MDDSKQKSNALLFTDDTDRCPYNRGTLSGIWGQWRKFREYPSASLKEGGAETIDDFCTIILEEANARGVRGEVVFEQAMLETGWLQYGGDSGISQYNFAGLGTTFTEQSQRGVSEMLDISTIVTNSMSPHRPTFPIRILPTQGVPTNPQPIQTKTFRPEPPRKSFTIPHTKTKFPSNT